MYNTDKLEPFTYYRNFYGYHLSEEINMEKIINEGLIPKCGLRSQRKNNNIDAIYFFLPRYGSVEMWTKVLFDKNNLKGLVLLKINLDGKRWFVKDQRCGDLYLTDPIDFRQIQYLDHDDSYSLSNIDYDLLHCKKKRLMWHPLTRYQKTSF